MTLLWQPHPSPEALWVFTFQLSLISVSLKKEEGRHFKMGKVRHRLECKKKQRWMKMLELQGCSRRAGTQ